MGLLKRNQLLSKDELKIEKVDLGNDEFVYVRQMTGREKDRFEQSLMREVEDKKGNVTYKRSIEDFRAKLAVNTVCDENGRNLLEPEDYPTLSANMSAAKLGKIVSKAQEINNMGEQAQEETIKNSDTGQTGDVTSESAGTLDTPTPISG